MVPRTELHERNSGTLLAIMSPSRAVVMRFKISCFRSVASGVRRWHRHRAQRVVEHADRADSVMRARLTYSGSAGAPLMRNTLGALNICHHRHKGTT